VIFATVKFMLIYDAVYNDKICHFKSYSVSHFHIKKLTLLSVLMVPKENVK